MGRMKKRLIRLFYAVFSLCFGWIWVHIAVRGYYNYREVWLLLLVVTASLARLLALWRTVKCHEAFLDAHSRAVTAAVLLWMFAWQLLLGALVRYQPIFDVDAVFGGAIQWAQTGSFPSYYEYYSYFPNNLGAMCLLHWVFRAAGALGLTDWYSIATAFNGLLSLVTIYAAGQIGRQLAGPRGQFMLCGMFLVSLPFYFLAASFYTDTLSMPFPALAYWLYLLAREQPRPARRGLLYALMGLAGAAGVCIKPTAGIMLVAIVLDAAFTWDWRRAAALAVTAALLVLGGRACLNGVAGAHLDREQAERMRTPVLHWVLMGLKGNGMYNGEDYVFTRSFDDVQERDAALKEEIASRVRGLGPSGMVRLLTTKMEISFGDGTYGLSDCLGGTEVRPTRLRQVLLRDGAYFRWYQLICTGMLLAVYALMIAAGARRALGPAARPAPVLAPHAAVFGLMLFLLAWEARWRYSSGYIPVMFLCALQGMEAVSRTVCRAGQRLAAVWRGEA